MPSSCNTYSLPIRTRTTHKRKKRQRWCGGGEGVPKLFSPVVPLTRSSFAGCVNLALKLPVFLSPNLSAELDLTPVGLLGYAPGNIPVPATTTSFPLFALAAPKSSSSDEPKLRVCVWRGEEERGRLRGVNFVGAAPKVRPPGEVKEGFIVLVVVVGGEEGIGMSVAKGASSRRCSIARPKNGSTIPKSPTVRVGSPSNNSNTSSFRAFSRTC
jgi:hypothetical protein